MSKFKSVGRTDNTVEWLPEYNQLKMTDALSGKQTSMLLSPEQAGELGLELAEKRYEVEHDFNGGVTLQERKNYAKVGEFYRYQSHARSMPEFQGNPIVKVVEVGRWGAFTVETEAGKRCGWSANKKGLTGPVAVEEKTITVWEERVD